MEDLNDEIDDIANAQYEERRRIREEEERAWLEGWPHLIAPGGWQHLVAPEG